MPGVTFLKAETEVLGNDVSDCCGVVLKYTDWPIATCFVRELTTNLVSTRRAGT